MKLLLERVRGQDLTQYKKDMQEAFQRGYEAAYGKAASMVLPEKDIDCTLKEKGAVAYKAIIGSEVVGGAVVRIDPETRHNYLDLLFVKCGMQSNGIGTNIWRALETLYPDTEVWETCTPYFEKRNIHFYVNVCGFHIVQYFHKTYPMPDTSEDFIGDGHEGMFELRKQTFFKEAVPIGPPQGGLLENGDRRNPS